MNDIRKEIAADNAKLYNGNPYEVDAIEWPEYKLNDAKESALREIFKSKDGRDVIADIVFNLESYKDSADFWNTIAWLISETDPKKIQLAQEELFKWAMERLEDTLTRLAEIELTAEAADDFNEDAHL